MGMGKQKTEMIQYIGIDPDLVKSGVAVWNGEKFLSLKTMRFFELILFLEKTIWQHVMEDIKPIVFLEAGWTNIISNYHSAQGAKQRERIAKNVGENHAVGKLIEEYLKDHHVEYYLVTPTKKKWDADTFKKITGVQQRTNSEIRDAARMVFGR